MSAIDTDLAAHVLPIFRVREGIDGPHTPVLFCGTGFVLQSGIFVTCWHCVASETASGEFYAAILTETDGAAKTTRCLRLVDLAQDANGADLAIARVDYSPHPALVLTSTFPSASDDVVSYGYPLVSAWPTETSDGRKVFPEVNPRFLRGYITQVFKYHNPNGGISDSFEVDMRAPRGLSGAPLFSADTLEVVGVVYGVNQMETTEVWASIDATTGERKPEIVTYTTFALAHWTATLLNAKGPALDGSPLGTQEARARAGRWSARAAIIDH